MRCFRFLSLTAMLLALQLLLTSCHGPSPFFMKAVKYVNEKDGSQVLELVQDKASLRVWLHGYDAEVTEMGHYSLTSASPALRSQSGRYVLQKGNFVLHEAGGANKESRFSVQKDASLRDDTGNTWRPAGPVKSEVIALKLK